VNWQLWIAAVRPVHILAGKFSNPHLYTHCFLGYPFHWLPIIHYCIWCILWCQRNINAINLKKFLKINLKNKQCCSVKMNCFDHFDDACILLGCFIVTGYFWKSMAPVLYIPNYKAELLHGDRRMTEFVILGLSERAHTHTHVCTYCNTFNT
jgi:hypothetical protein